jgi:hypothetical protein
MAEQWLTYQQAGDALGMSAEAVRQRARRLGWRTQPGNEGRTLVLVPDDPAVRPRRPPVQTPVQPAGQTGEDADLAEFLERLEGERDAARLAAAKAEGEGAALREVLGRDRERADKAEAAAAVVPDLRERLGRAEGESGTLREQARAERDRATAAEAELERARLGRAAAEAGMKELREALAEARRPFWRRWLG